MSLKIGRYRYGRLTREEKMQELINTRLREGRSAIALAHLEDGQISERSAEIIAEIFERQNIFYKRMGSKVDCSQCTGVYSAVACQERLVRGECQARLISLHDLK